MKMVFTRLTAVGASCAKITGLITLLLCLAEFASAGVVITIPSTPGTDTSSFTPTNRRFTFSQSRMLFSSTEVGATGTITAIAFQKASGSTSTSINYITVYMRETTSSTITTTIPAYSGYKRVAYSTAVDNTMSSGWTTITLSTLPADIFTYSGGSNYLDILVVKETSEAAVTSAPNFPVWNTHTTSGSVSAYYYGTSSSPTTYTTLTTKRPNIQLTIENTCAGKPAAGTVSGPSSRVCPAASFTLNTAGLTLGTGMHYQWQSRNAGSGSFTNMGAADTFTTLTTSTSVDKDYRIYSQCLLSGQSDTSTYFTVNVLSVGGISASSDTTFCAGGSVLLTTSTVTGVTYTWFKDAVTTGFTGSSYTANASGTYTVRASTSSCSGIFSNGKIVTVNPLPTATVTPLSATTFCDGSTVVLQASTGTGYTYQWQKGTADISGETGSTYTAAVTGNYRVKITNSITGCSATSTAVAVTVNPTPVAFTISGAGGKTSYCASSSLTLSTTFISGLSYQWENSSGLIAGATSASYNVTSPETYALVATLGSCSKKSNSLTITENPLPPVGLTPSGAVSFCNGDSLKVSTASTSGVSYQWRESGTPIGGAPNSNVYYVKTAGTYTVKVTYSATGCSDVSASLNVTIIAPSVPTIAAGGPTEFCQGGSVTLNGTVASGLTTQWQEGNADLPGETAANITTSTAGIYRLKVTNGVGCAAYSTPIEVIVNPLPDKTLTISGGTDICNGTSSAISAPITKGYTYQWRKGGVDMPGETYNPYYAKTAGIYSVNITDSNGCKIISDDVTITVRFTAPFYVTPFGNTFFCEGDTTILATRNGFASYQWYLDGTFIPGATDTFVAATKNGKYTVKILDAGVGCFATSTPFNITVIPGPGIPIIMQTGSRLSTNVKGVRYQWYKNGVAIAGATDSFTYTSGAGIYKIQVTNDAMCSRTASLDLTGGTSVANMNQEAAYIKMYPNPTTGILHIDAPESLTITVTDLQGRVLFNQKNVQEVNMSAYAPGMYMVLFSDEQGNRLATQKVSKVE